MSIEMNVEEAVEKIRSLPSPEEVSAFVQGDERKTVVDAAQARIKELQAPKQGEVEVITQPAADFKEGVQATKEIQLLVDAEPPENYVTAEDVIKSLREKGYKI